MITDSQLTLGIIVFILFTGVTVSPWLALSMLRNERRRKH